MKSTEVISAEKISSGIKVKDISLLFKSKLSALVVFSSVLMYLFGMTTFNWFHFLVLCIGGFLLSGAANGFNQVWEKDLDIMMDRTKDRPIPSGRMTVKQAIIINSIAAVIGIFSLWFFINTTIGILALLAIFSYVFLYTPLKQKSVISVFVGAFPGAIPPLLGYVAATGTFSLEAGILFLVQFAWQFPHFWSIAWVVNEDYNKAGFFMLPDNRGQTKKSALVILISSLLLLPAGALPWFFPVENAMIGWFALSAAIVLGAYVLFKGWELYKNLDLKSAKGLMFSTFIYLPVIQIIYVIDRLL